MNESAGFVLHHIGWAVRDIKPVADAQIARFGYRQATDIIHDPLQTAFVEFLKLPNENSYLELVAPDGPHSYLQGAIGRGGGLNHLCYTVADLKSAIGWLQEHDMRLIFHQEAAVAFAGRRICWLLGEDRLPIELLERLTPNDLCVPGVSDAT